MPKVQTERLTWKIDMTKIQSSIPKPQPFPVREEKTKFNLAAKQKPVNLTRVASSIPKPNHKQKKQT